MRLRTLFFWFHLAAGVVAGAIILVMCVTGVLLTYERQIYAWMDGGYRSQTLATPATRLPVAELLARVQAQDPDVAPASITVNSRTDAPVAIAAGQRTLYADAYSGQILGETRAQGARRFMSSVKAWHRWLAVEGDGRPSARAITGWSNLLFLFIVGSGLYLWFPRRWTWQRVRAVTLFSGRLRGKARDFNWHNVIGSWSLVPLFVVVFSAVPISFPWASNLVYRAMGDRPPAPAGRDGGPGGREGGPGRQGREGGAAAERRGGPEPAREAARQGGPEASSGRDARAFDSLDGVDALLARAQQQEAGWRTIALRLPQSPRAPLAFAIDRGDGGQPQLRSTLTLTRNGEVVSYETIGTQSPGRRARSFMRFAHTGEVFGLPGQTIAGIATGGGAVLVYTGIALAVRRLLAWLARRRLATATQSTPSAA